MNKECSWQHELSEGYKLKLRLAWMNQNLIINLIISRKILEKKRFKMLFWSGLVNCPYLPILFSGLRTFLKTFPKFFHLSDQCGVCCRM